MLGQEDVLATALCYDDGARWRQGRLYMFVLFDGFFEVFDFGRLQFDNGIEVIDLRDEICSVEVQVGLRNVKALLVHWAWQASRWRWRWRWRCGVRCVGVGVGVVTLCSVIFVAVAGQIINSKIRKTSIKKDFLDLDLKWFLAYFKFIGVCFKICNEIVGHVTHRQV